MRLKKFLWLLVTEILFGTLSIQTNATQSLGVTCESIVEGLLIANSKFFSLEALLSGVSPEVATKLIGIATAVRNEESTPTPSQQIQIPLSDEIMAGLFVPTATNYLPRHLMLALSDANPIDSEGGMQSGPRILWRSNVKSSGRSLYLNFRLEHQAAIEWENWSPRKTNTEVLAWLKIDIKTLEILEGGSPSSRIFLRLLNALKSSKDWRGIVGPLERLFALEDSDAVARKILMSRLHHINPPRVDPSRISFAIPTASYVMTIDNLKKNINSESFDQWIFVLGEIIGSQLLASVEQNYQASRYLTGSVLWRFERLKQTVLGHPAAQDMASYFVDLERQHGIPGLGLLGKDRLWLNSADFPPAFRMLLAVWTYEIFRTIQDEGDRQVATGLISSEERIQPGFLFKNPESLGFIFSLGEKIPLGFEHFESESFVNGRTFVDGLSRGILFIQGERPTFKIDELFNIWLGQSKYGYSSYHDISHLLGLYLNPQFMRQVRKLAIHMVKNFDVPLDFGSERFLHRREAFLIENFVHPRRSILEPLFNKYGLDLLWDCQTPECVAKGLKTSGKYLEFLEELWANRNEIVEYLGALGVGSGTLKFGCSQGPNNEQVSLIENITVYFPNPNYSVYQAFASAPGFPGVQFLYFLIATGRLTMEEHFTKFLNGDPKILIAYHGMLLGHSNPAVHNIFSDSRGCTQVRAPREK